MMHRLIFFLFVLSAFLPVRAQNGKDGSAQLTAMGTYSESDFYTPRKVENKAKSDKVKKAQLPDGSSVASSRSQSMLPIPVSVFRKDGTFVTGLGAKDFKIFVDNAETEILSVNVPEGPLHVVLLFDVSPSAEEQFKSMKELGEAFVAKLQPNDTVLVASFGYKLKILSPFTDDRALIKKAIQRLEIEDGTSIYEAVSEIFERDLNSIAGRTAVIIFTDGVDTTSRKADYESSLVNVEKTNISVIPIYYDTYSEMLKKQQKLPRDIFSNFPVQVRGKFVGLNKDEYVLGQNYLSDLFKLSGGRPIPVADLIKGKTTMFDLIPTELRSKYYITIKSPSAGKPGSRHSVKVRVSQPNLTIFAKGSYLE
jgi:VWFA-related protein